MRLGLITRRLGCGSSVVERVIGNDEVGSSILPHSTISPLVYIIILDFKAFLCLTVNTPVNTSDNISLIMMLGP